MEDAPSREIVCKGACDDCEISPEPEPVTDLKMRSLMIFVKENPHYPLIVSRIKATLAIGVLWVISLIALSQEQCPKDCHNSDFIGSGVLVYRRTANDRLEFLLGFESGRGWSSLGGGPIYSESSANRTTHSCETSITTAIREAKEESRGVLTDDMLKTAIKSARHYEWKADSSAKPFITYVLSETVDAEIPIELFDKRGTSNGCGENETTELQWISIKIKRVDSKVEISAETPNDQGLYEKFERGLMSVLDTNSAFFD